MTLKILHFKPRTSNIKYFVEWLGKGVINMQNEHIKVDIVCQKINK